MPTPRSSVLPLLILTLALWTACAFAGPLEAPVTSKTPASPLPTAAEIYGRSLTADDSFSYQGRQITTYWRNGRTSAVLVSHRAPDSSRIDYQAPDSQRGRLLVSDGQEEWQFDPRMHLLLHRVLASNLPDDDDLTSYNLLRENYLLHVEPALKEWAERPVFLLSIKHKESHVLARKLWVDAGSGLVLKREIYHDDGKLAVTVAYSDINFHPSLPRALFTLAALAKARGVHLRELTRQVETVIPLNAVRAQLAGAADAPKSLIGYSLVGVSETLANRKPLLHLRYSDGLNLVSLFEQRRTQSARPTLVPSTMRPLQIGRRLAHVSHRASLTTINWDTPTLNLTLMGELAEPSLIHLAAAADAGR